MVDIYEGEGDEYGEGEHALPDATSTVILFACRKNAGRSQIAAAIAKHMAGPNITVLSAGSEAVDELHPETSVVLEEIGLEPISTTPKQLEVADVEASDWVITMGCGETCPIFPGKHYEDWEVADPFGQPLTVAREIRDDIQARVGDLLRRIQDSKSETGMESQS